MQADIDATILSLIVLISLLIGVDENRQSKY